METNLSHSIINKENNLYKIFSRLKYKSTKHTNYFYIYDELFKKYIGKKITIVEIGIACGGSLFMWKEYFKGNARVIGIDFNPDTKKWKKEGFEIFIGNQSDKNFWKTFFEKVGKIDILIDDGGHTNEQQLVTFLNCHNNINSNGLMIFEDTHASYLSEFGNPSKYSFVNFCFKVINEQNIKSLNSKVEKNYLKKIHKVEFFQSIIVFHIHGEKSQESKSIDNKGIILNSEDYRLKDVKIFSIIEKVKLYIRKFFPIFVYNKLKKIYPIFKYFVFKIRNLKNRKYFN